VLGQRSPLSDVQELHAAADCENGYLAPQSIAQQSDFVIVTLAIDASAFRRFQFPVKRGINITAAAQD
jgi:hypothetical protein